MVHNVHVREIDAPAEQVGALLDTLGGPADALWPLPWWAPTVLEQPLRVGSGGGHSGLRYHVDRYEPGRSLRVAFDPGQGLDGTCAFTVEPLGPDRCRLRVDARGRLSGPMRLVWPLAIRWLHDALIEDLLDRAERAVGAGPASGNRWSTWVRVLRRCDDPPGRDTAREAGTVRP